MLLACLDCFDQRTGHPTEGDPPAAGMGCRHLADRRAPPPEGVLLKRALAFTATRPGHFLNPASIRQEQKPGASLGDGLSGRRDGSGRPIALPNPHRRRRRNLEPFRHCPARLARLSPDMIRSHRSDEIGFPMLRISCGQAIRVSSSGETPRFSLHARCDSIISNCKNAYCRGIHARC